MRFHRCIAAAALLALGACVPELAVPDGAHLTCKQAADCPAGRVCHNGACVAAGTIDTTPPDLAEPPLVSPAVARAGATCAFELATTEPLDGPALITLSLDQPLEISCPEVEPGRHRCAYSVTGQENGGLGGLVSFDVKLVDKAGNEALKRRAGSVDLDFAPPALAARSVAPAVARLGSEIQVFFTASEPLAGQEAVLSASAGLDGGLGDAQTSFPLLPEGATLNYRLAHAVTVDDPQGEVQFSVSMTDVAGNSVVEPLGTVRIDSEPPALVESAVETGFARKGTEVVATFQVSKTLQGPPVVTVGGLRMVRDAAVLHPRYRFTRAAQESDSDGIKAVVVEAADEAGNQLITSLGVVRFDFTPPSLLAAGVSPAVAKRGAPIFATLTASEPLSVVPILHPTQPAFLYRAGTAYVFEHEAATEADGDYTLTVDLVDQAGNASTDLFAGGFAIDASVPEVSAVMVTPARIRASGVLQVTFNLSEVIDPAAGVAATVGGRAMGCTRAGLAFSCSRAMAGNEIASGTEAAQVVLIQATDLAGNLGTGSGSVVFDFRAPDIVSGSEGVELIPAAQSPLRIVSRVAVGTKIRVGFTSDETLNTDPLVETLGAPVLGFARAGGAGSTYLYQHTLTLAAPRQGAYTVRVTLTDLAGNAAARTLSQGFMVDTLPPALPATTVPSALLYRRAPWGSSASATPLFTLEGQSGAVEGGGTALVLDGPDASSAGEIGRVKTSATGAFGPLALSRSDRPVIHVAVADDAGNLSLAEEVKDVEWIASLGGKVPGSTFENPTLLETSGRLDPTLAQDPTLAYEPTQSQLDAAKRTDAISALRAAEQSWAEPPTATVVPRARMRHAMAYDSARGVVVLHGGYASNQDFNDTWEWSGRTGVWVERTPPGTKPVVSSGVEMVYDSGRGKAVLFEPYTQTTWEWDEEAGLWSDRTPLTGPSPTTPAGVRYGLAMAYDARRAKVVLFSGQNAEADTWEWDGTQGTWTERTLPAGNPPQRYDHGMAYDSARGKVVLFGGYNNTGLGNLYDTWEWDGDAWTDRTPASGNPPGNGSMVLSYDADRRKVVLYGGYGGGKDLWEWNGSSWSKRTRANPWPCYDMDQVLVYDASRRRSVLFGGTYWSGCSPTLTNQIWDWDGDSGAWTNRTAPPTPRPPPRTQSAMAYDSFRRKVVLFGGLTDYGIAGGPKASLNDTWEWDAATAGWRQYTPALAPSVRTGHAMAYDAQRKKVVLFGGYYGSFLGDTWEWDGSTAGWAYRASATPPSARYGQAMVYDASRRKILMVGGAGNTYPADYTWEYDGSSNRWFNRTPITGPGSRTNVGLAYDSDRNRIVLYGGSDGVNRADTWEWDGGAGSWTQRFPSIAPSQRYAPPMAFDASRGRVLLFGGAGGKPLADVWEWDGRTGIWLERTPALAGPGPRRDHMVAYDSFRARVITFGGTNIDNVYFNDLWEWDGGAAERPAAIWTVPWTSAGEESAVFQSLTATASAGGLGHDSALVPVAVNGIELLGWDRFDGRWMVLDSNDAGTAAPAVLEYTTSARAEIERLVRGPRQALTFAVAPKQASGKGLVLSGIALDSLELSVRYHRRACPDVDLGQSAPAQAAGSTAGAGDLYRGANCGTGGAGAPEHVFAWQAPAAGTYVLETVGSAMDTLLYVRDASCTGTELACDDNSAGAGASRVSVTLAAGQSVRVVVDGAGAASGSYLLRVCAGACQ